MTGYNGRTKTIKLRVNDIPFLLLFFAFTYFLCANNLGEQSKYFLIAFTVFFLLLFISNYNTIGRIDFKLHILLFAYIIIFFFLAFFATGSITTSFNATMSELSMLASGYISIILINAKSKKILRYGFILFLIIITTWSLFLNTMLISDPNYARMAISHELDSLSLQYASPYGIAQAAALIFIFLFNVLFSGKYSLYRKQKIGCLLIMVPTLIIVVLTRSAITLLTVVFFGLLTGMSRANKKRKTSLSTVICIVLFCVIIVFLFHNSIGQFLINKFSNREFFYSGKLADIGYYLVDSKSSLDTNLRLMKMQNSINGFLKNPLFGAYYTHNIKCGGDNKFFDVFADYGIFVGLLFISIMVRYIKNNYKNLPGYDVFCWLPLFVFGLLNNLYLSAPYYACFMFIPIGVYILQDKLIFDNKIKLGDCKSHAGNQWIESKYS